MPQKPPGPHQHLPPGPDIEPSVSDGLEATMNHVDVAATALLLIETGEPTASLRDYLAEFAHHALLDYATKESMTP